MLSHSFDRPQPPLYVSPVALPHALLMCSLQCQAGYAVIFLTRTGSIQPFTQDLPLTETVPLLQALLNVQQSSSTGSNSSSSLSYSLQEPAAASVAGVLRKVEEVQRAQVLLTIPFTTIFEYLQVGVCGRILSRDPLLSSRSLILHHTSLPPQSSDLFEAS